MKTKWNVLQRLDTEKQNVAFKLGVGEAMIKIL